MRLILNKNVVGAPIPLKEDIDWQESLEDTNLFGGVVHVWYGSLQHSLNTSRLLELLSTQEQLRARQFVFDIDRKRFIARRAFLRLILSAYLGISPSEIVIKTNTYGKPEIKSKNNAYVFSLSYSKDRIIYAISKNRRLGIDIEHTEDLETRSILSSLFPPEILGTLKEVYSTNQILFFKLWTSLEAYLKAVGTGFALPMDEGFWKEFPLEPLSNKIKNPNWSIVQFVPETGLCGTLMVDTPKIEIVFLNCSDLLDLKSDSRIIFSGE